MNCGSGRPCVEKLTLQLHPLKTVNRHCTYSINHPKLINYIVYLKKKPFFIG